MACPENRQLPSFGRSGSRWGPRGPHATKSLANFPPSSAEAANRTEYHREIFSTVNNCPRTASWGHVFRNLVSPLRSHANGCQMCVGDEKAPKRSDESQGTGVKGGVLGALRLECGQKTPASTSTFHGGELSK